MVRKILLSVAAALVLSASAAAAPIPGYAVINGASEVPPNASPAVGVGTFAYDFATDMFSWDILYVDALLVDGPGSEVASHIHQQAPASNVGAPIINLPLTTLKQGSVKLSTVAGANVGQLLNNEWYVNIHTPTYPGGEIRGQIIMQIPEPALASLGLLGGMAVVALRRRVR